MKSLPKVRSPIQDSIGDSIPNMILDAWKTNNRVTVFLIERLPAALWEARVPGAPRRTIRMIAGHMHNARCMWLKTLGKEHGIPVPPSVSRHTVKPEDLICALQRSGAGILGLLQFACDRGGWLPATSAYVWRNLPLDAGHLLSYFVAHEGHHRGQIVMLTRQLDHRLPAEVTDGLWQWSKRAREA
ncbi:MAG TPA: DinB family protein [Terracidiphilus sp.]|jgi:uncharacterized damage-inducible protein DinB